MSEQISEAGQRLLLRLQSADPQPRTHPQLVAEFDGQPATVAALVRAGLMTVINNDVHHWLNNGPRMWLLTDAGRNYQLPNQQGAVTMHEENNSKTYSSYQEYLDEQIKDGGALAYAQLLIESHTMSLHADPFGISASDILWPVTYLMQYAQSGSKPDNFYDTICSGDIAVREEWLDRAIAHEVAQGRTTLIGHALMAYDEMSTSSLAAFIEGISLHAPDFRFVDGLWGDKNEDPAA